MSSLYLLKSIREGSLYLGPLETMLRILESGMNLKFPVTTDLLMECLHSHESEVLASMSRSDTSLLKLNIIFLIGVLYLEQIICSSEFWNNYM